MEDDGVDDGVGGDDNDYGGDNDNDDDDGGGDDGGGDGGGDVYLSCGLRTRRFLMKLTPFSEMCEKLGKSIV